MKNQKFVPVVYHPDYVTPIPQEHRFPMPKFKLLYELLLKDGITHEKVTQRPPLATKEILELVHKPEYIEKYCTGTLEEKALRRIGLPWSEGVVKRTCTAVGGTILTAQIALKEGICCNTAGGTHHAFPDYGSGFCIFNDIAITCRYLLKHQLVKRILIIDLDVHQGDGTAYTFSHQSEVFTFSMHCEANFPYRKQISDLDIPLPVGLDDDGYLQILAYHLEDLLTEIKPDLVIYDAGVDTHREDKLGKLCLTNTGLYRRERLVISNCLARGYPVACVIGGGYAKDINELVYRHSILHRAVQDSI
ncbi:MAG: histone deacetylase [Cyanobacterium sp. T60_A2020_053]|nr:histone deacetylase [Cyanobacterium sp. T60_A2020_053]